MADLIDRTRAVTALDSAAKIWQLAEPYHEGNKGIKTGYRNAARILLGLPSVDSVEVVRCINCKLFKEDMFDKFGFCKLYCDGRNDDDFCSKAVPK